MQRVQIAWSHGMALKFPDFLDSQNLAVQFPHFPDRENAHEANTVQDSVVYSTAGLSKDSRQIVARDQSLATDCEGDDGKDHQAGSRQGCYPYACEGGQLGQELSCEGAWMVCCSTRLRTRTSHFW